MSTSRTPARRRLGPAEFLHFHGRPLRLRADSGSLWITVDGRPEDILLEGGSCRDFDGGARLTVGTVRGDALLSVTPLSHTAWLPRLVHGFAAWRHGAAGA